MDATPIAPYRQDQHPRAVWPQGLIHLETPTDADRSAADEARFEQRRDWASEDAA